MESGNYNANHASYDTNAVNADPLRLVPLDVVKGLEHKGLIVELYNTLFGTTGVQTLVRYCERTSKGIAEELKAAGIDGVILTSA